MESWSKEEVGQFIAELGFADYSEAFATNDIDGQLLCILDDSTLLEIGVVDSSARDTILSKRNFYMDGDARKEPEKDKNPVEEAPTEGSAPSAPLAGEKRRKKRMQFKDDGESPVTTDTPAKDAQPPPEAKADIEHEVKSVADKIEAALTVEPAEQEVSKLGLFISRDEAFSPCLLPVLLLLVSRLMSSGKICSR
jgi:hypothetical protein